MQTSYAVSSDGTRIAYDMQGSGPALLLVHGYTATRQTWHKNGCVGQLTPEFSVITLDLRGRGESDQPTTPTAYSLENIMADLHAVADHCQIENFLLWGHSWGATIGLEMAVYSKRVQRAIIAGTIFGKVFTEAHTNKFVAELENAHQARQTGNLTGLTPVEHYYANRTDLDLAVLIACTQACRDWPAVEPEQLLCPTLIYAGTEFEAASTDIRQREATFRTTGLQYALLEGLNHAQEITELDVVLPLVRPFLRAARS